MTEKQAIRTDAAPAPFQGAPYSQAIAAGGFVFVSGQVGIRPGETQVVSDSVEEQWGRSSPPRGAASTGS